MSTLQRHMQYLHVSVITAHLVCVFLLVACHITNIFNMATKSLYFWFSMEQIRSFLSNNTGGDKVNMTTQYFLFQQLKQCITFLNSNPFHLSMSLLQSFLKRKNVTVHSQATSSSKCPFWNESWAPSRTVTQKYILIAIHSNSVATVGWSTVGALTSMSLLVQKRHRSSCWKLFSLITRFW